VPDKYFLLPYGQTAGLVMKWFRDNLSGEEVAGASAKGLDPYDLLTELAREVPPASDGLVHLPHLMGAGSPEFNSNAKGVYAGMTLEMGKGHYIRAIMEGVACMIRKNLETINRRGIVIDEMIALGGGAKSELWNQIKADITNIPVTTLISHDNAALGAAILAGIGVKVFQNFKDGCDRILRPKKTFYPNPENKTCYNQVFEKYNFLYDSLVNYW
jgi:xylulokinase